MFGSLLLCVWNLTTTPKGLILWIFLKCYSLLDSAPKPQGSNNGDECVIISDSDEEQEQNNENQSQGQEEEEEDDDQVGGKTEIESSCLAG